MPLSRGELTLEASPRSVQEARHWAAAACHDLGRADLVDSAELGISELVTNAILHGAPPIAVRVRGTHRHPRIEVLDGSRTPPVPNKALGDEDELFATFGRGLGMVAMCSHAWGADVLSDGKVVWFEPADEPVENPDLAGQLYSPDPVRIAAPRSPASGITVRFPAFPMDVFLDWRRHFRELRRELRLLALAHEGDYPVASTITELFERFDHEIRAADGAGELDRAAAAGVPVAEITFVLSTTAPALLGQLLDVLDLADAFCRDQRLLSLAATEQQKSFQQWFVGEVVRQSAGRDPLPWPQRGMADQQIR